MSPFRSIKGKLLLFALCIALIPISVGTTANYLNARRALKRQITQDLTAVAEGRKAHVVAFLEAKKGRTVDFSSDGFIRDRLEEISAEESLTLKKDISTGLNAHLLSNKKPLDPYIEGIEVVDMDGRVVAATHETMLGQDMSGQSVAFARVVDKDYTETCVGQPHFTPYLDANTICIAAPITSRKSGDTIGVIVNHYNMAFLNEVTTNRTGMGETGEVVLGQRKGDDIVFLNSLLYAPDAPLNLTVPLDSTQARPMRLALEGGSGAVIAPDYRGVDVVAAYQDIPSMDWGLVAKIDKWEAFAPLKWLGIVALAIWLITAAAAASVAFFFAFSFSRPINRLRDTTDRFAAGDLKARAKITRRDEIGKLARSFDNMAGELEGEIAERERREIDLRKLSLVVEQSPNLVVITDSKGKIEYVNPTFTQVTGYTPEEAVGQTPRILRSGKVSRLEYKELWKTITSGNDWRGEFCNRKKNGDLYWESKFISPTRNDEGTITHFISVGEDITERRRAEETIHQMAYYDLVTGLPNRTLFNDRLGVAIAHAHRGKEKLTVMFLDLDQFKVINDTLGHGVGDQLLKAVGERLERCLREGDTVARQGGDEFTILLPGARHEEDAFNVARKVLETIKKPFLIGNHELNITTSIGIVLYPDDGGDAESLLRNADAAMYHAKEQGRDNYQHYTKALHVKVSRKLSLEGRLRHALEREEFVLYYQPLVDINTGRIVGAEALIRWRHPEEGLIPPGEFIPAAESTGLIVPISDWVLRTACLQNKAWRSENLPSIRMSINLSAHTFRRQDFTKDFKAVLDETGVSPHSLEVEITESAIMQNVEANIHKLQALNRLGVQIAIDDFGTGYSSLSYLKRFPIQTLKIDRSFVGDATTNPDDAAIVRAIVAMAKTLNLKVIAEGVETEEQLAFIRDLQCEEMQGYLFSRPVPADEFKGMLRQDKRLSV